MRGTGKPALLYYIISIMGPSADFSYDCCHLTNGLLKMQMFGLQRVMLLTSVLMCNNLAGTTYPRESDVIDQVTHVSHCIRLT